MPIVTSWTSPAESIRICPHRHLPTENMTLLIKRGYRNNVFSLKYCNNLTLSEQCAESSIIEVIFYIHLQV